MTQDATRPEPMQGYMDPPRLAAPANHGRTVASWALFWICLGGALVIAAGAFGNSWAVIYGGAVVIGIGIVVSIVLRATGHGQPKVHRPPPTLID